MGGTELKYALLIDTTRCSVCFACQVACKDEFVGNIYPPYSYPQPDSEQEWIKVTEIEKGRFPYAKVYPIPILCMHCDKAPCIEACPVSGGIYKNESGVVIIDPAKCDISKCKTKPCIEGCPYRVIFFNDDSSICQKCTLCMHRLKEGKEPACVNACSSDVFAFGEESQIVKEAKRRGAKWMNPEYQSEPRVYYIGLPSPTLAGHVISEENLMDVPDVDITITDNKTGLLIASKSNVAGNFLVDNLETDTTYTLKMERQGYLAKTVQDVRLDIEYKHLGDVKLSKSVS